MTPEVTAEASTFTGWIADCVGVEPVRLTPIAPGLGHRRFLRVELPPGADPPTLILRIDPPEARRVVAGVAPEPPLEPIRALLEAAGLPVPRSFGNDEALGVDLLEDVGDRTLETLAHEVDAAARRSLHLEAIDLIAALQHVEPPDRAAPEAFTRRLDRPLIATKARKVVEWLLPEALGRDATSVERRVIESAFHSVADLVDDAPSRLAHRDYKAANIHVRPNTALDAPRRLVLIDLQGAFMAPPEYDLLCLLRDSHVPLAQAEIDARFDDALARWPDAPEGTEARLRFDALTLTRVGKDVAHYLDAARSRGDDRYLGFVATGLGHLRTAAARLAGNAALWRDVADLIHALPLPARCAHTAANGPLPCAR